MPTDEDHPDTHTMSFGDHLEELRRRLIWCMGTLFLCVGVMLPFKDRVTNVYTGPYRYMWDQAYQDYLAKMDLTFQEGIGPADPEDRLAAAEFLSPKVTRAILAGDYPKSKELDEIVRFERPYPAADTAEWPAYKRDFAVYADKVRYQLDLLFQL